MTKSISVSFNNQTITAFMHNDTPVVALKPICENMGLDWRAQRQRILRHPVLSKGVVMITTPSEGGEQTTTCLPLDMLNGWLFGVDANRVKPEIKDNVIAYQFKCFKVLADHFGMSTPKRITIDTNQARAIQKAVNRIVKQTGKSHQTVYHDLKTVFNVAKYDDLTPEQFPSVCNYLGFTYEGELMPRNETPAIPEGMVLVRKDLLEETNNMIHMINERFALVEKAENDIQHAFNLLSVITSGHMKQASDAIREARYRLIDPIKHAKSYTGLMLN